MNIPFVDTYQITILGKFIFALALGGIIGFEREISDKPAGLRTHMLVVGATCLLMSLSDVVGRQMAEQGAADVFRSDALRVVQGIVVGIGFLGAGTIIRRGTDDKVEGLTTAATILLSSVIGIYVGLSQFAVAVVVTLIAVFVLHKMEYFTKRLRPKNK